MNRIFPFILVEDAKKAIEVYINAFHAALLGDITYYKEWDDQAPYPDKIVHAALRIEDSQMFIADAINEREDQQERFTVNIELSSKEAVLQAFEVLKENAIKLYYQPQDVGWSELGFSLKDQFNVLFLIYYRP